MALTNLDWTNLNAKWDELRQAVDERRDQENNRQFWDTTEKILTAYLGDEDQIRRGTPGEGFHFPFLVAWVLRGALQHILSGNRFEPFDDLIESRKGDRRATPQEQADKLCAMRYLEAVRVKLVIDSAPIKTVMSAFKVARSTVQGWKRNIKADLDSFHPDSAPEFRKGLIRSQMEKAGKRYARASDSHAAISVRANKRKAQ